MKLTRSVSTGFGKHCQHIAAVDVKDRLLKRAYNPPPFWRLRSEFDPGL